MQRYLLFPLMHVILMLPVVASAVEMTPRSLLDRMSHSFRELNYQGTFSFQQGDTMESLRLEHAVIDGKEYERLEYMDGDRREIIRRGHDLSCIHPGHELVRFYQQQKSMRFSGLTPEGVEGYYQFTITGKDRVAGRSVVNLKVSPKDTHRFGYRLSLDEETGLLLRTELIGSKGKVLERFQFVEIKLGEAIDIEHFKGAKDSHQAHHVEPDLLEAAPAASGERWMVNWLPAGFTSVVSNLKVVTDDMVTFTDGLTVFSVFLERNVDAANMQKGVEGRAQRGATTAYSRALILGGQPHRVTVVGEIPVQTAQLVAKSIVLVRDNP